MEDGLQSAPAIMTTEECSKFYKDRPYKQQKEQPTGFCKCGRPFSQCECKKEKK